MHLGRIPTFALVSQLDILKLNFCSASPLNEELSLVLVLVEAFLSRSNCLCNDDSVIRTAMSNTKPLAIFSQQYLTDDKKLSTVKKEVNALPDTFDLVF